MKMKSLTFTLSACIVLFLGIVSCTTAAPRKPSFPLGVELKLGSVKMSPEERAADMAALFEKIRIYKPMAEEIGQVMGLPPLLSRQEEWVQKARSAKDNLEYLRLVEQVRMWMMQTGHADRGEVYFVQGLSEYPEWAELLEFKPELHEERMGYWRALATWINPEAHSELPLVYRDGGYFLSREQDLPFWTAAQNNDGPGTTLAPGSRLVKINGVSVDEWVRQSSFSALVFYDPKAKKLFNLDPFLTHGPEDYGWKADFLPPGEDTAAKTVFVKSFLGAQVQRETVRYTTPNVAPLMLKNDAAYIRIRDFSPKSGFETEVRQMQDFIRGLGPEVKDLIIDVRGNRGGMCITWLAGLAYPLATKEITFTSRFRIHEKFAAVQATLPEELNTELEPVTGGGVVFSQRQLSREGAWLDLEGTVTVKPMPGTGGFRGKVTILSGRRSYSATELFNMFFQETGLATLAGEHSRGGGGGHGLFNGPLPIMLPYSGIVLLSELGTGFRADGTFWSTHSAQPDLWLPSQRGPFDITPEALLQDPWVQAVLALRRSSS